jgi:hypothetical protein
MPLYKDLKLRRREGKQRTKDNKSSLYIKGCIVGIYKTGLKNVYTRDLKVNRNIKIVITLYNKLINTLILN